MMAFPAEKWAGNQGYQLLRARGYDDYAARDMIARKTMLAVSAATAPVASIDMLLPGIGKAAGHAGGNVLLKGARGFAADAGFEAVQNTAEGLTQNYVQNKVGGFDDNPWQGSLATPSAPWPGPCSRSRTPIAAAALTQ